MCPWPAPREGVQFMAKKPNTWQREFAAETKATKESPDGHRIATVVREGGKDSVVVDGSPQTKYDYWIEKDSLTFSPDSTHLAYVVRDSEGEFVVLDGIRQRTHGWIDVHKLVFSPNSRRFAYVVRKRSAFSEKDKYFVVADGRKMKRYDSIKPPVFTPDSRFLVYVAGDEGPMVRTHFGDVRLLTHFYLVVQGYKPGIFGFLMPGRCGRRFPVPGVGSFFPEVSSDSKLAMAVDRNNRETRLTVNVDSEL